MEPSQANQTAPEVPSRPSGGKNKKIIAIFLLVIAVILIAASFFFYLGNKKSSSEATPTPEAVDSIIMVDSPEPEATDEPEDVDMSDLTANVLNGTGIPKEASFVSDILKDLGYEDVEVGNASDQNQTVTLVVFSSNITKSMQDKVVSELEKSYKTVKSSTSSSAKYDVEVTTGTRTGSSATKAPTATPKASATLTPTVTPTTTPTSTPTATP